MTKGLWVLLGVLAAAAAQAAMVETRDGLRLTADLPARIGPVAVDGSAVSTAVGGLSLTDPRTGKPPAPGEFTVTAGAAAERGRVVLSGIVVAAGDKETVCQLQAALPVGGEGWLFWDNMTRSRPIRAGEAFDQPAYPLACVTTADRRTGLAVALDPDPLQPAGLSYDPSRRALVATWRLGFTPLGRPEFRMRAPFKIEVYRLEPGWAFRSALGRYYRFHPNRFDWRARYEGLWEFATETPGLPNPQHYAYNEGGPPATADKPRGIHTFPYTCTGDLIIQLPPEWGVPKTYDEMLDRLERWSKIPRIAHWDKLSDYSVDTERPHGGKQCVQYHSEDPKGEKSVRQVVVLGQKKPEAVTVSVWTRAQDVAGAADANYGLWLDLLMADGTFQFGKAAPAAVGSHDWERISLTVGGDQPIQEIRLYLLLRGGHTGTAWFDDLTVATAGQPERNLALTAGFESTGPPPELQYVRDNVMYDQHGHMRYFPDTWGGADVGPASPINWLRFWPLVNPDQTNPEGRQTEAGKDLERIAGIFRDHPDCAGIYMDGTSSCTTVTYEYRRDFFRFFTAPFMYEPGVNRVCASGMASVIRYVDEFKRRFPGKLAFGNVWASNRMFPMCMALDVPGYESSRWYDLDYADYYRAALYHKPGPYLNYFRIGQQLDTREGGERFFRYATAYGIFPSIGRFTDEAYEKFGDLQHRYVPIIKRLFRAGWEPVTHATAGDAEVRVQRFGTKLPMYLTFLNPTPNPREVKLTIEARALGLREGVTALEMSTSANLPLVREGKTLKATVSLGPEDVAVVVLLPEKGVAAWYREQAAEVLQGAAYVYAQTPPTNACADLSQRVRRLAKVGGKADVARAIAGIEADLARLEQASGALPADLKRASYRRELAEVRRLLDETLLADTGARVGWRGRTVVQADEALNIAPEVQGPPLAHARVAAPRHAWGRLVETGDTKLLGADAPGPGLRRADPAQSAVTFVSALTFTDAAGRAVSLQRFGYGYFGAVSELKASYSGATREIVARLRNLDSRERRFRLELTAPAGITLGKSTAEMKLPGGESAQATVPLTFAPTAESGSYAVRVAARLPDGTLLEETTVQVPYVLPLEPGNLALPAAGTQVAVDSAYYAYSEKPLTDGVVAPTGEAFNLSAWAAAETGEDHWIQLTWPTPRPVARVVVYWNIENDTTWTSQRILAQAKLGDTWQTLAEVQPRAGEPVTTIRFAPMTTAALRLLQPKGSGSASRPNIMWVREVAAYGP